MTPDETFAQMVAEGDSVLDRLDDCARAMPDKVFIHYGEDGVKLTFAEFKQRTDRIAAGLAAMGVTEGGPVSVLTRNSLVSALAMFAIWRAGGIFAPVNFNFRGQLLSYQLRDTEPRADHRSLLRRDAQRSHRRGGAAADHRAYARTGRPRSHRPCFRPGVPGRDIVAFAELCASDASMPASSAGRSISPTSSIRPAPPARRRAWCRSFAGSTNTVFRHAS